MFINYLLLPTIPNEVLESLETIRAKPYATGTLYDNILRFKLKDVNPELIEYLQTIFPFPISCRYQFVFRGLPVHIDNDREYAINYLLDTGGKNVVTNIHNSNLRIIESVSIEPFKWHSIQTSNLHSVDNIDPDTTRIAISVGPAPQTISSEELLAFIKSHIV